MTGGRIGIAGAGAFGTALAVNLARDGRDVTLWMRDAGHAREMQDRRENVARLPGVRLPDTVTVTSEISDLDDAGVVLLCLPMQALRGFLIGSGTAFSGRAVVACCKGIDLQRLSGPTTIIAEEVPGARSAILTGPSFAGDIAKGLPTALTLACADAGLGAALQHQLSTAALRVYLTDDVAGAELGGALKNVIAIAAGVVIGAGLGDSARAALMTRGFAEMMRLALVLGARAETLGGLSGLGDLVLTCTSEQSRNFRYGVALGSRNGFDPTVTVEGVATAKAVSNLAEMRGLDLPITRMVAALVDGHIDLPKAIQTLLSRPLKKE